MDRNEYQICMNCTAINPGDLNVNDWWLIEISLNKKLLGLHTVYNPDISRCTNTIKCLYIRTRCTSEQPLIFHHLWMYSLFAKNYIQHHYFSYFPLAQIFCMILMLNMCYVFLAVAAKTSADHIFITFKNI